MVVVCWPGYQFPKTSLQLLWCRNSDLASFLHWLDSMECITSMWTHKKLIYKLQSQFIKFLLEAYFFLGTKIIVSSLQGTLPSSIMVTGCCGQSIEFGWLPAQNLVWTSKLMMPGARAHAHTHTQGVKRFFIPIMKLSGESRTGLSSWTKNGLKELWKRKGGWFWAFVVVRR